MPKFWNSLGGFITLMLIGAAVQGPVASGQFAPPADYYATVTGNPATLKSELRLIIADNYWTSLTGPGGTFVPDASGHQVRSYDALRQALAVVDSDPDNPGNIILAYTGASVSGEWDQGVTWNREHRWPKAVGVGTSGPDYSDMHHLVPSNPSANSSRGDSPFGTASSTGTYGKTGSYWFPGDNDQPARPEAGNDLGDVARAMFYMVVRYDGSESNTVNLELKNGTNSASQLGDLAALLAWHYRDPPSAIERRRNHLIFSRADTDNPLYWQGNRNPFVDRPEYAWALFGSAPNDSKLYVGASAPADGASAMVVDFGTLPMGAPPPSPQSVTLHKAGGAPTYYEIRVAGSATCTPAGRDQAFVANAGSRVLSVGLPADVTATLGLKTGTITIDNLDLTSQGSGAGALDGDDVITVQVFVGTPCSDPFADVDGDGDVDQSDFAVLQLCYDVDLTSSAECTCLDWNRNGFIDPPDFNAFQMCFGGADVSADPACDD